MHRLSPAHALRFEDGRVSLEPCWVPHFESPPASKADFQALAAELRQHVQDAVAAKLDSGKPAPFLSGGTDSSTVACMIGRAAGRLDARPAGERRRRSSCRVAPTIVRDGQLRLFFFSREETHPRACGAPRR